MGDKIKVLIVDDSAIVRDLLSEKLSKERDIEVVGTAPDPYIARDKIVKLMPDVITLDIEMPRMDGLTFLEKLMAYYPMPIIIVSSVTTQDPYASIKALDLGAFDVVNKPGSNMSVAEIVNDIIFKIRQAYQVKDTYVNRKKNIDKKMSDYKDASMVRSMLGSFKTTDKLIAIGSSTGGTVALEFIMKNLPGHLPPIVITQHMPPMFTKQFANRLNELSQLTVKEAENDEMINAGTVYIAPGGLHLILERRGAALYTKLDDSERVHYQKPAADVMFNSIANVAGKNVIGFLLTGMGKDGAAGLLNMKNAGAYTLAQDEMSSIVWGMPKAAIDMNAHCEIISLEKVPKRIVELSQE